MTFEEVMGDVRKKSVLQINFQWEKLARTYLGQIISCTGKKISLMTCGKKSYPLYAREKRFGKNILTQTKSPIPASPTKVKWSTT